MRQLPVLTEVPKRCKHCLTISRSLFPGGGGKLAGAKIRGQQRNGTPRRGPRHVFGCGPGARGIIPLTSHATACDLALEFSRDDQVSEIWRNVLHEAQQGGNVNSHPLSGAQRSPISDENSENSCETISWTHKGSKYRLNITHNSIPKQET
jgi:hypothetical protein